MRVFLCLLAALLVVATASAQVAGSGTIEGTITDPSGASVPGASVTATNVSTGVQTSRQTTDAGFFVLTPLQPGEYSVMVRAGGFEALNQEHIVVDALATVGLKLQLHLGTPTETVTVEGAPPVLHTDDATLGSSIDNNVYAALPLPMNGVPRDPTQFVGLVPGVNNASVQAAGPSTAAFNGGQTYQNEVYLEGMPLTSAGTEGDTRYLAFAVSVDAVDQFQVQTNGAKAQFQGQGVENYVLKSGTNGFHGAAFEFFRNTDLDARNFFSATRAPEHQNEFGGFVGGPIKKDKIFFFGNYDAYKYASGSPAVLQSIPTTLEQSGNFSQLPSSQLIYDPRSQTCNASGVCTRTTFPGQILPASVISPVSQKFQSYLPTPSNSNIQNNYVASLPIDLSTWNTVGKVDVNLSDRHRLFGFIARGNYATNFTGSLNTAGAGVLPEPYTQGRIVQETVTMSQLHDTFTIKPNLLNQFSYSFNRIRIPLQNPTTAGNYTQQAGLKGLPNTVVDETFPDFTFSGNNAPGGWQGANAHFYPESANTFTLQDNILWVKGRHSVVFGFQAQQLQDNYGSTLYATFTFANTQTAGYNSAGTILSTTGNAYASYLLGAVSSSGYIDNAVNETGGRYKDYAAYVQDDWKVSSRLTVNLGMRWDFMGPFAEVVNRMTFFNPTLANPALLNPAQGYGVGALEYVGNGTDSCNCTDPVNSHYKNFGPRVGLAYSLDDKTVLRAGYGIFYSHVGGVGGRNNSRQGLSQLGFNATNNSPTVTNNAPAYYWDGGIPFTLTQVPPVTDPTYGTGNITQNVTAQNPTYGDPNTGGKPAYYEDWSISLERSLPKNLTISLAYSASLGKYLAGPGNGSGALINQTPLKYLALGSLLAAKETATTLAQAQAIVPGIVLPFSNYSGTIGQMLKPFPQYGTISSPWSDYGQSNYQGGQFKITRRMSSGLTFSLGYTRSKELDNLLATPRDPFNWDLEKARGAIDHTNVFTGIVTYQLPFGAKRSFNPDDVLLRAVISNWTLSGIVSYATGAPLALATGNCTAGGILGSCFSNYNPAFSGNIRINGGWGEDGSVYGATQTPYLDKTAFLDPLPYTWGTAPRNAPYGLTAPAVMDTDISVRREIPIRESIKVALEASAFNVFNQVCFAAPGMNPDATSFGTLTAMANQPRKLQFNARITF